MKKVFFYLLSISVFLCCIAACIDTKNPLPYGKWKSNDPDLIIDINPEDDEHPGAFIGTYHKNGEKIDVYVRFSPLNNDFWIFNISDSNWGRTVKSYEYSYFQGSFKLDGEKLYYTLKPYWEEKTGYKVIIFEKVEDYDTTDQEDKGTALLC